jgi:hypothetical protein
MPFTGPTSPSASRSSATPFRDVSEVGHSGQPAAIHCSITARFQRDNRPSLIADGICFASSNRVTCRVLQPSSAATAFTSISAGSFVWAFLSGFMICNLQSCPVGSFPTPSSVRLTR